MRLVREREKERETEGERRGRWRARGVARSHQKLQASGLLENRPQPQGILNANTRSTKQALTKAHRLSHLWKDENILDRY